ncbi:MAG: MAPEG family protein [Alphaproteobacteria bacterium]|nr:MAPEG family protein [Alphaproteobacteria bacterium]
MLNVAHASLLTAIVTVIALLMYFWTGFRVGGMRSKHGIKAPAVTGNFEFECAYRVQMNTLEQMVMFLPLLWLSNAYFMAWPYLTGALGLVWVVGRIVYAIGYMQDPSKREAGFIISALALLALLITTIWGIANAWIAVSA